MRSARITSLLLTSLCRKNHSISNRLLTPTLLEHQLHLLIRNDQTTQIRIHNYSQVQDRHEKLRESTQESIRTESESQNTMFESLESELTTRLDLIKTSAENFETRREKIEEEMSEFAAKSSASAKESRVQVLEEIKSNMSDVESTLESSKTELKHMTETCVQNTNERMTNAVEKFDRNTVNNIVSSHRAHTDNVLDKEVRERASSQFKSREEFLENSLKDTVSFCESVHKSVASDVVSPVRVLCSSVCSSVFECVRARETRIRNLFKFLDEPFRAVATRSNINTRTSINTPEHTGTRGQRLRVQIRGTRRCCARRIRSVHLERNVMCGEDGDITSRHDSNLDSTYGRDREGDHVVLHTTL